VAGERRRSSSACPTVTVPKLRSPANASWPETVAVPAKCDGAFASDASYETTNNDREIPTEAGVKLAPKVKLCLGSGSAEVSTR